MGLLLCIRFASGYATACSTSARLQTGSVETSKTRLPPFASLTAVALATDVFQVRRHSPDTTGSGAQYNPQVATGRRVLIQERFH